MINQGNNVPENTIVIFQKKSNISNERLFNLLKKSPKKRDWFTPHYYRCLPLIIGNQYGFTIQSEYDIILKWNGGSKPEDLILKVKEDTFGMFPVISTHFGNGILTISPPFVLRTPPGVNLMTINPPNVILPNITVMTGVIETDNIRKHFTFNLKLQMPNIELIIPAGTPLAGFIPIPRYFADKFELKLAEEIFNKSLILEEQEVWEEEIRTRVEEDYISESGVSQNYFKGQDVFKNKFNDHQKH